MLTGRGIACVVLATTLIGGGWALSLPELFACGIGMAAVTVLALLWVWIPRRTPHLTMSAVPNPAFARSVVMVNATLSGRSMRSVLLSGPISDGRSIRLWAKTGRRGSHTGSFPVPVSTRGTLVLGPFRMESTDPLGIARRAVGSGSRLLLRVRPVVHAVPPLHLAASPSRSQHDAHPTPGRSVAAAGTEPAGLRPYVEGDELRLVHWTASARGRGLMVRTFDPDETTAPVALLDDRAEVHSTESFELAIEAVASLLVSKNDKRAGGLGDTAMVLWSDLVQGNAIVRLHGDAALDRLVDIAPKAGLPCDLDNLTAFDLLVTGPYQERGGAIPLSHLTLEMIVDPRNTSGTRSIIETRADLARWTEIVR